MTQTHVTCELILMHMHVVVKCNLRPMHRHAHPPAFENSLIILEYLNVNVLQHMGMLYKLVHIGIMRECVFHNAWSRIGLPTCHDDH